MINVIFTIDYEIYGNGEGSLKDHILIPTYHLKKLFDQYNAKIVFFVEAAELEKIEEAKSDAAIDDIKNQIAILYSEDHEIALHLHPQWYNGKYNNGQWVLDNSEYNLCILPEKRIAQIVDQSINYLRYILKSSDYNPLSFRAGNWLFQPTQPIANILLQRNIKIDSSVFKGGLQHQHRLDYRPALPNGYFWAFKDDVNKPDVNGKMMEFPIYVNMVPPWWMATGKRLGLQQKAATKSRTLRGTIYKLMDMARPLQPLKFDFCRMTLKELTDMMNKLIAEDQQSPELFKPIVAIGHTKDLVDVETVNLFLSYLKQREIKITTFQEIINECI